MSKIENNQEPIVLLLAAGLSRRMGDENKLLLRHDGQPLIAHSAAVFRRHFSRVYIVTGFEAAKLKAACTGLDVNFIHNPDYERGLGSSFVKGITELPEQDAPVLTALADQIFLQSDDIKAVQEAYNEHGGRKVIIPQYKAQRGHPVLFPPKALAVMRAATPVMTGRHFIEIYPQDCHFLVMTEPHCILDIDTPEDARQHLRPDDTRDDRP